MGLTLRVCGVPAETDAMMAVGGSLMTLTIGRVVDAYNTIILVLVIVDVVALSMATLLANVVGLIVFGVQMSIRLNVWIRSVQWIRVRVSGLVLTIVRCPVLEGVSRLMVSMDAVVAWRVASVPVLTSSIGLLALKSMSTAYVAIAVGLLSCGRHGDTPRVQILVLGRMVRQITMLLLLGKGAMTRIGRIV